jgi:hypothetical protein
MAVNCRRWFHAKRCIIWAIMTDEEDTALGKPRSEQVAAMSAGLCQMSQAVYYRQHAGAANDYAQQRRTSLLGALRGQI